MATPDPGPGLLGRSNERSALDLLVSAVRAGESQTLVLREDLVLDRALRVREGSQEDSRTAGRTFLGGRKALQADGEAQNRTGDTTIFRQSEPAR
jgi:hypothetical protein